MTVLADLLQTRSALSKKLVGSLKGKHLNVLHQCNLPTKRFSRYCQFIISCATFVCIIFPVSTFGANLDVVFLPLQYRR